MVTACLPAGHERARLCTCLQHTPCHLRQIDTAAALHDIHVTVYGSSDSSPPPGMNMYACLQDTRPERPSWNLMGAANNSHYIIKLPPDTYTPSVTTHAADAAIGGSGASGRGPVGAAGVGPATGSAEGGAAQARPAADWATVGGTPAAAGGGRGFGAAAAAAGGHSERQEVAAKAKGVAAVRVEHPALSPAPGRLEGWMAEERRARAAEGAAGVRKAVAAARACLVFDWQTWLHPPNECAVGDPRSNRWATALPRAACNACLSLAPPHPLQALGRALQSGRSSGAWARPGSSCRLQIPLSEVCTEQAAAATQRTMHS